MEHQWMGLPSSLLNELASDKVLLEVSRMTMCEPQSLGYALEIEACDMYNCLPENSLTRRDKKIELLQLWKRQKGKNATNHSLLNGIKQCTLDRQLIEFVVDMMKKENCLEQEVSGSTLQEQKIDHLTAEVTKANEQCTVLEGKMDKCCTMLKKEMNERCTALKKEMDERCTALEKKVNLLQNEILQQSNRASLVHDSIKEVLGDQFCKDTSSSSSQMQSFVVDSDVESCNILTTHADVLYADTVFASTSESDTAKKSEKECISSTDTSPVTSPARVSPLESTSQVGNWLDAELHIGSKRPYSVIDDTQN